MTNSIPSEKKYSKRTLITAIIKYFLIAIIIYFAGKKLADNWQAVIHYQWHLNWFYLILSVVMQLVTYALLAQVWCFIIAGFGYRVSLSDAYKISYIANLGRYIPGKIWPVFGMIYLAKKIDIKEEAAMTSWGLAQMFAIPASLLACFIAILFYPQLFDRHISNLLSSGIYIATFLIFLISLLMVLIPDKTLFIFNQILKLLKRPQVQFKLNKMVALKVYLGYFVSWVCFGFSFWLFLLAIIKEPQMPVIAGIGAFVIAYQIGYLTIFSPGGLGVRELTLTVVLTPFLGPIAAGVAIASRLWNMTSEIIAALIALKIKLSKNL